MYQRRTGRRLSSVILSRYTSSLATYTLEFDPHCSFVWYKYGVHAEFYGFFSRSFSGCVQDRQASVYPDLAIEGLNGPFLFFFNHHKNPNLRVLPNFKQLKSGPS